MATGVVVVVAVPAAAVEVVAAAARVKLVVLKRSCRKDLLWTSSSQRGLQPDSDGASDASGMRASFGISWIKLCKKITERIRELKETGLFGSELRLGGSPASSPRFRRWRGPRGSFGGAESTTLPARSQQPGTSAFVPQGAPGAAHRG